ncbi:MAG: ATP-binding cassette domain-containing protein [Bifidobacteriaceae bacterium]|jgi:ATPase subunit of ABC transporter with duplicated ATPase domains|nr:ATP-binding cassette domain-containing protein [Bifidobacteriaceae bacterium]
MITASGIELRAGAELLVAGANLRVGPGDRIGLVGRNGAGKTTLTRVLAGEVQAAAGTVRRSQDVGYLPQDPRTAGLGQVAMARMLSVRGLHRITDEMRAAETAMGSSDEPTALAAVERYAKLEAQFIARGGYAAGGQAARIAANLGLDNRALAQTLGTLSGGQRRRVELARVLFSGADTLLLDEPTNHLDADSVVWLRDFLRAYDGGFVVISHDVALLRGTVTSVAYLDASRRVLDHYAMGWDAYLEAREVDERRRKRERANAEKKAGALLAQANKMRAKATKAVAAQNMERRAVELLASTEGARAPEKVAAIRFPDPAPSGKTPIQASDLSKSFGSLDVFAGVDLAIDRGSKVVVLGLNGAGKTTLLRILAGLETPDTGEVIAGHGLRLGYYAQEHETLDVDKTVLENMAAAAPDFEETAVRNILGSFLFSGDAVDKPARVLSGGEKTRLALATLVASSANVLLLDEPTNNLDPASRGEILRALRSFAGAVVLVTHDEGAVRALSPERVLLLPDGDEDLWRDDYMELVELA